MYNYCVDINECESRHNCPKPSFCVNTHGSYDCECLHGTRLDRLNGCLGLVVHMIFQINHMHVCTCMNRY